MFNLMFNIFEQDWFQTILGTISIGVAGLITYGFALLNTFIKSKIKNEKLKKYSEIILNTVKDAVLVVQQTFVDGLKKDGDFNKDAQKKAFLLAFEKIRASLDAESIAIIKELHGNVDIWLTNQIEAIVHSLK